MASIFHANKARFTICIVIIVVLSLLAYSQRRAILNLASPTIVKGFHHVYYNSEVANKDTLWLGTSVQKTPMDLWVFQELIYEIKPDVIIETGTYFGGSALFYASMLDLLGHGKVISIDFKKWVEPPAHPRVQYILGSSVDEATVSKAKSLYEPSDKVMVFLDSSHVKDHVLKELKLYGPLVSKGSYIIVEDSNLNNIVPFRWGEGPFDAVQAFLSENPNFSIDSKREKFLLTFNPGGYLQKIK